MDICIILNTITFMLYYDRAPVEYVNALNYLNYFFITIFFLEISSKIYLYRLLFIKNPEIEVMNIFEVFLLLSSIIATIFHEIGIWDSAGKAEYS